jgi:hypothetical protein
MPFAGYTNFADCVAKNKSKGNPQGYCAVIMRNVEGKPKQHEAKEENEFYLEQETAVLDEVRQLTTVGGFESPDPGELPKHKATVLAQVYADCRSKQHGSENPADKEKCAKIAWGAVRRMENVLEHRPISQTRTLEISISPSNFTRLKNGGLQVNNIIALAEGTWTDSAIGTPLHYPARILEKDAENWIGKGIWSRHQGGSPRAITDRIGMIKNPRYDAETKAIVVDGIFHGRSQASKDVIQMIEDGEVTDVSAEVGGKEVWNAETKRYEAASLAFYGFATVDRGACTVCKMKRNEAAECEQLEQKEREDMETKELEQKLAALETEKVELAKKAESEKAELTKQLETVSKSKTDGESAHKTAVEAMTAKIAEYETRIKELEKQAAPPITKPGNGDSAPKQVTELEVLTPARILNGEVSRA